MQVTPMAKLFDPDSMCHAVCRIHVGVSVYTLRGSHVVTVYFYQ